MKKNFYPKFILCWFLGAWAYQVSAQVPVNPNATEKTKEVLMYIYNAKDEGFITGQHNYAMTWIGDNDLAVKASRTVSEVTGKWPGLWGSDFAFTDPNYTIEQLQVTRQKLTDRALEMWQQNSIITLTYHMVNPKYEENAGWDKVREGLSEAEYLEVITPGTPLYNNWKRNMDRVMPFMKELQDKGAVVVWRPYHEMNGIFWWGSGQGSKDHFKQLWINTYDYMVNTHGLNNLIWFWSPNHWTSAGYQNPTNRFPGLEYVDMLGVDDYYWNDNGFLSEGDYNTLVELAEGKPLAIGEGFNPERMIPSPDWIKENRPEYRWFMIWDDHWIYNRTTDEGNIGLKQNLIDVYNHPGAINREDIHFAPLENDSIPPTAPTNLTYTELQSKSVSLGWNSSFDNLAVTRYEIFVDDKLFKTTSDTTIVLTGLTPSTTYSLKVRAKDRSANVSEFSEILMVTTEDPETIPPSIPTNIVMNGKTATTISLYWEPSTDNVGVVGYDIFVDGELKKTVTSAGTTIQGLAEATEYSITIAASDDAGNISGLSNPFLASTYAPEPGTVSVNDTEFTFSGSWDTSSGSGKFMGDDHYTFTSGASYTYNFTGTRVLIFTAKAPHHGIASVSVNGGEAVEVDLFSQERIDMTLAWSSEELPYGNHSITVTAKGTKNPAASGIVVSADRIDVVQGINMDPEAPTVPQDLVASDIGMTSATLTWAAATDNYGVTSYSIFVNGELNKKSTDTTTLITGLSPNTSYMLSVKAQDGAGNLSEFSEEIEITTAVDNSVNILLNGGFEEGLTGWEVFGGDGTINSTPANVQEGANSLKVGPTNWSWIQQSFTSGFTRGETYILKAWGKAATEGQSVRVAFKYNGGDLKIFDFASTLYEEKADSVTIPIDAEFIQVYITNRTNGTGYVDNIQLLETDIDVEEPIVPQIYQAENASLSGGASVASSNTGYTGTGYVDMPNMVGPAIEWEITVEKSGIYDLAFRYANSGSGVPNRPLVIRVNENPIDEAFPFPSTGGGSNWAITETPLEVLLSPGTYTVRAGAEINRGPNIDYLRVTYIKDTLSPSAPANLSADAGINNVLLNWEASTDNVGVNEYNVYQDGVLISSTENTELQISNLSPSTTYEFSVEAIDFNGNTSEQSSIEVTTLPEDNTSVNILQNGGFEQGLTGWEVSGGNGTINSTPANVQEGANALKVGPANWSWIQQSFTSGFTRGETYLLKAWGKAAAEGGSVRVAFKYNGGDLKIFDFASTLYEEKADSVTIPMDAAFIQVYITNMTNGTGYVDNIQLLKPVLDEEAPTAPGNLQATATMHEVQLSWNASIDNLAVTAYKVYQGESLLRRVTNLSTEVTGLMHGTDYTFKVSAVDERGNESSFTEVLVTTAADTEAPTAPTDLLAFSTEDSISVSWTASSDNIGVTGYNIYLDDVYQFTSAGTDTVLVDLIAATTYRVEVSAIDDAGNESALTEVVILTKPTGITDRLPGGEIVKIFPNPFVDSFKISLSGSSVNGHIKVLVTDLKGKVVAMGKLHGDSDYTATIDMSGSPSGLYLVKLMGKKLNYSGKVKKF